MIQNSSFVSLMLSCRSAYGSRCVRGRHVITMETTAAGTNLVQVHELVERLRDLLDQVEQLQVRVPGCQRRGRGEQQAQAQ